jgi:hypothetical protein
VGGAAVVVDAGAARGTGGAEGAAPGVAKVVGSGTAQEAAKLGEGLV